jgi:hypothetical protein
MTRAMIPIAMSMEFMCILYYPSHHYCHTRPYLEISAKLKIWQISACKIHMDLINCLLSNCLLDIATLSPILKSQLAR